MKVSTDCFVSREHNGYILTVTQEKKEKHIKFFKNGKQVADIITNTVTDDIKTSLANCIEEVNERFKLNTLLEACL